MSVVAVGANDGPGRLVLLGHPVAHSLSPVFQNAALRAARLPLTFEALDVPPADLRQVLLTLRGVRGAGNVTVPHKEAVHAQCEVLSDVAARVRAVNTFAWRDEVLHGHNTDVAGARTAMRALMGEVTLGPCAIVGAGGSAAAAAVAALELAAPEVRIWSRTATRTQALVDRLSSPALTHPATLDGALDGATLVVNATPVGLHGEDLPVDPARLSAGCRCLDLVYRPGETAWVRACRAAGRPAEDGLRMLVEQGAAAFAWWFGVSPDRNAIWQALRYHGVERPWMPPPAGGPALPQ